MATGDYCIFMNAGDTFVAPDTVNTVVAGMERGDDVVYGDIVKNGVLKPSLSPRNCHKMFYCHQSAFTSTACLLAFPSTRRTAIPPTSNKQSNSSSQGSVSCIQRACRCAFRHARCVEHATLQRTVGQCESSVRKPTVSSINAAFCRTCFGLG